ncbi:MAG: hypothetical protein HLUCCX14_00730 [Marinobacter excellens HL-55]|uniref:Uncharacterized protein n=1 Tax=Marinobacter excellens HL-55 TaxID=1305731 RepID=A0A0N8KLD4_9GAMM|nr:MAG: hypothetical protein HLUCCX14_00730 [Marinobacter excellens HL-55]
MLTTSEKDALYILIAATLGDDLSIRSRKSQFNNRTFDVVEDMIIANMDCNANLRELIVDLLGGSSMLTRGWLKQILKTSKNKIKEMDLHGYGCLVSTKSRWKSAIVTSVIW